jgi:hypothetical protein
MAGQALSSSAAKLLVAKQSARGVVPTTDIFECVWIDGSINSGQETATQEVFDGEVYSSPRQVVSRFSGEGNLTLLADPVNVPLFLSGVMEVSDFTGSGVGFDESPYTSELTTDAPGNGDWLTFWIEVGQGSEIVRRRFQDCKVTQAKLSGTSENQFVQLEISVVCVEPQAKMDALPAADYAALDIPFTFADGEGNFLVSDVGTTATHGINQFEVTFNRGQDLWQGDSIGYHAAVPKRGSVELATTLLLDDESLPMLNKVWYGTATPSNGQQPVNDIFYDSFELKLERTYGAETHSVEIVLPKVAYTTESAVDPNLEGGAIELPLAGRARKATGEPVATVTVVNGLDYSFGL